MNLFPITKTYGQLIQDFNDAKRASNESYEPERHQRDVINPSIRALAGFEASSGIIEARALLAKHRVLTERLESFEKIHSHFSQLGEAGQLLVTNLVEGKLAPDNITHYVDHIEDYSKLLNVTSAVIKSLQESLKDIATQKAKLPKTALADAVNFYDPLTRDERAIFEAYHSQA